MLFNIVLICLMAYVCITPYFFVKVMNHGIRLGMKVMEFEEPDPIKMFDVPKKKPQPKMTPEEKRSAQILANIDRYDGTPNGQEKIHG